MGNHKHAAKSCAEVTRRKDNELSWEPIMENQGLTFVSVFWVCFLFTGSLLKKQHIVISA
jgi:hypothetical protein